MPPKLTYKLIYAQGIVVANVTIDIANMALQQDKKAGNEYSRTAPPYSISAGNDVQILVDATGLPTGVEWELTYAIDGCDQTPGGPIKVAVDATGHANFNDTLPRITCP